MRRNESRHLWARQTLLLGWAKQSKDNKKTADYKREVRQIGRVLMARTQLNR